MDINLDDHKIPALTSVITDYRAVAVVVLVTAVTWVLVRRTTSPTDTRFAASMAALVAAFGLGFLFVAGGIVQTHATNDLGAVYGPEIETAFPDTLRDTQTTGQELWDDFVLPGIRKGTRVQVWSPEHYTAGNPTCQFVLVRDGEGGGFTLNPHC